METTVMYVGWATVIGVMVLACGWVWYYALFWWFNAIKNSYAMTKFFRMYVISMHRKRRRDRKMYRREVLLSNAQFADGDSTPYLEVSRDHTTGPSRSTARFRLVGKVWQLLNTPIADMLFGSQSQICNDDKAHQSWCRTGLACPACLAIALVKAKPLRPTQG